jgi:hypothetical protein
MNSDNSLSRFQIFISKRLTGLFCTLIAILAINCWQQVLPNFDYDCSFSVAAARNLSEGHGYSIQMASTKDYSKSYYDPLNKWPPGYSLLLILMKSITGTDWIHAIYILNGIALSALVLVYRKILFQLEFPVWIIHIAIFCFGFVPHAFTTYGYTDFMALLFYLCAISLLTSYVRSERPSAYLVLLAALCLAFTIYLKYLYIGLAFIPLAVLGYIGFLERRKEFKITAVLGLVVVFILSFVLFTYQYIHSGQAAYIKPTTTGFFPEQLIYLASVVPSSLINIHFYSVQIGKFAGLSYQHAKIIWSVINLFCLIWLGYISWIIFKKKPIQNKNWLSYYALVVICTAVVLFIILGFLSVRINKYYPDGFNFSVYVMELRYFAAISFFIQQFVIYIYLFPRRFFNPTGARLFRVIILLILAGEVAHGSYFLTKEIYRRHFGNSRIGDQAVFKALELTARELSKGRKVVVFSETVEIPNSCSLIHSSASFSLPEFNNMIPSSETISLLTVCRPQDLFRINEFLAHSNSQLEFKDELYYYYITIVPKSIFK